MKMSELILAVGDDHVQFQNLLNDAQTAAKTAIPDPIVCGQILSWFHKKQPVTFFIAWWLDTKTL